MENKALGLAPTVTAFHFGVPWLYVVTVILGFLFGSWVLYGMWDSVLLATMRTSIGHYSAEAVVVGATALVCHLAGALGFRPSLQRFAGWPGHLLRCCLVYAALLVCSWFVFGTRSSQDYGLYVQLFLWSGAAAVAVIPVDLVVVTRPRSASRTLSG